MADNEKNNLEPIETTNTSTSAVEDLSNNEIVANSAEMKKESDTITEQTRESEGSLKDNVIDSITTGLEGKTNTHTLQRETETQLDLRSYEGYIKTLSHLLLELDLLSDTAHYKTHINKSGKETLNTAIKKIEQYKKIINGKKKSIEHEFKIKNRQNRKHPDETPLEVNISNAEINELENRRFRRKQQIEYDIKQGQNGKSSNMAPRPNQSLEQVLSGNKVDKTHNNYDVKLNEALQDAAFLRIFDNNEDAARTLLQRIASNSLTDQDITFCQVHMQQLSPYFENYGFGNQVYTNIQTRGGRYSENYNIYGNIDGKTAYKKGGVTGWLNNTLIKAFPNAKPEDVSSFSNLAIAAGGIYAIYRIGKRFFSADEKGKRHLLGKGLGLAGVYFAPKLLLGQDGFSLLGDILSGKADFSELKYRAGNCLWFMHNNNPEVYAEMAPGLLGMMMFPQNYTVANVRALQQTFSDNNARKQRYSATYTRLNEHNSALANEFQNTFNSNQYNENEWKLFLSKLGITDKTNGNSIIFNEALRSADKKTSLELRMKSQGKRKNPDFKQEIDGYLKQKGEFNPNNLNPNWFIDDLGAKYTIREIDLKNKESLNNNTNLLPIDFQKKQELTTALETFYDKRTIESKPNPNDFSLRIENGLLVLKSNGGNESKINLETKELAGFGNGIRFSNLSDLLNTADLTNKILETQKGKVPVGLPAFQHKLERKGICFNDATTLSWNLDTRTLSTGWRGATIKIDTLYDHPKEYAEYLSNRRLENNKIEINSNLYPMVKKLSNIGIVFTNENEVKELETWLTEIKEQKKFSIGTPKGNPFKISWQFKEFDKKLVFTAVNGEKEIFQEDISKRFPTIMANKDIFLTYMNNPDNGMRGSVFN